MGAAVVWMCFDAGMMMIKRLMVLGVAAVCGLGGVASAEQARVAVQLSAQVWQTQADGQLKRLASPSIKTFSGEETRLEMPGGASLAVVPKVQGEQVCVKGELGMKGAMRAVSGCFGEEDALVLPLRVGEARYEVRLSRL